MLPATQYRLRMALTVRSLSPPLHRVNMFGATRYRP